MKKIIVLSVIYLGVLIQVTAQTNVTFLHGINDQGAWNRTAPLMQQEFRLTENRQNYVSDQALDNINNGLGVGLILNGVLVGHSMGGLVSRDEIDENRGSYQGLITLGTPHNGAPIAPNLDNAGRVFGWWLNDLSQGWARLYGGGYGNYLARLLFEDIGGNAVQNVLNDTYDAQSLDDMAPGSAFMNGLNRTPNNTLTGNNTAIWGSESFPQPWRLAESAIDGQGLDRNILANTHAATSYLYFYMFYRTSYLGYLYMRSFFWTWNWYYLIVGAYYYNAAAGFYQGYASLNNYQQVEWSAFIDGAIQGNNWFQSDGVVPAFSAAPGFIPNQRRVLNANHFELLNSEAARDELRRAILNNGIPRR